MTNEQAEGAALAPKASKVGVKYGPYSSTGDHAGKTVAALRKEMSATWQIPEDATGLKGKEQLADSYVIQATDVITFFKRQGEKGYIK